MSALLMKAAQALIDMRETAKKADEAKREAEAMFIALAQAEGVDTLETDEGIRVSVENRPRRDIDVSVLAEFLPVELVAQVLKEVVDPKAFDNAVGAGLIHPEVADKAVTTTYSTQVRVYGEQGVRERRGS